MKRHVIFLLMLLAFVFSGLWGQSVFWTETFDNNDNAWTLDGNWTINEGLLRLYYDPTVTDYDLSAISPVIQLPVNVSNMIITQLFSDYTTDSGEILEIIIRVNNQDHILWTWDTDQNNSWPVDQLTAQDISFALSDYAGQSVQLKFRSHGGSTWNINNWDIFNINILCSYDNDLAAINLSGSNLITEEIPTTFSFTYYNPGLNPQSNYTLELYNTNNLLLTSTPGATIAPAETLSVSLNWTATEVGQSAVYAKVNLANDVYLANNSTPAMTITVLQSGTAGVYVGNPNSSNLNCSAPINFYFKTGITQCLYYPDELTVQGLITNLRYFIDLEGDIPAERPFKIWMANTEQTSYELNSSWIPYDQFTLVYDGNVTFTETGLFDWDILLQTPFVYEGNNLCIMMERPMDTEFYSSSNSFVNTDTPNHQNRMILYSSDTTENVLPDYLSGYMVSYVPNTVLFFNTTGLGDLTGIVTNQTTNAPIENAKVSILNSNRYAYTNQQGVYTLPYLSAGTYNLTAQKIGYYNNTLNNIEIFEDQITTANLSILPVPTFSVSGHITGSDAPNGVAGVNVKLSGYTQFTTQTDDLGNFTFPAVFQGYTYNLEISHSNYISYNSTVTVADANQTLPDINLTRVYYAYVGNPESTNYNNTMPFDLFYKNSYVQAIYKAEEMNIGGLLTKIQYQMHSQGDIPNDRPLKIWIGETELTSFESNTAWIPLENMQLCYDSTYTFPALGDHIIELELQNQFAYGGGNLVVATNRPMDTAYYNSDNAFICTNDEEQSNRTLYFYSDTIDANPASPQQGSLSNTFPNTKFYFNTQGLGTISGIVTDSQNNQVISGAKIKINNSYRSTNSNESGAYTMNYVIPGNYTLTASKHGYYDALSTTVVVNPEEISTCAFALNPLPRVTVTGRIIGNDAPNGLANANVKLLGYDAFDNNTTDSQGYFSIPNVFASQTYNIRVYRTHYQPYTNAVVIGATNTNLGTINLNELANSPRNVNATLDNNSVDISWNSPSGSPEMEFRYDDGNIIGDVGYSWSDLNSVFGAVHLNQGEISQIHWYLSSNNNAHASVDLYIMGLSANGMPNASNILYSASNVSNIDDQWNQHLLPASLSVENGFFVGIASNGWLGLGIDDGIDEPYSFKENCQYSTYSYLYSEWSLIEANGINGNLAIRAVGIDYGPISRVTNVNILKINPKSPEAKRVKTAKASMVNHYDNARITNYSAVQTQLRARSLNGYRVFKLDSGQEANPDLWEMLGDTTDSTFTVLNLPATTWGYLKFAVKAKYTNNVMSQAGFSNMLEYNVTANVHINVQNLNGTSLNNATVRLTNYDQNPDHIYEVPYLGTTLLISNVRKGSYKIECFATGYTDYLAENVSIVENNFNYNIQMLGSTDAFFDSFENVSSFDTNFPGWIMLDIDQSPTVSFAGISFPGNGSPMSFMAFVPSETNPPLDFQAYDGNKMAACFSASTGTNNDWMITPQISIGPNMLLTFYARSYSADYTLDRFKVGVAHSASLSDLVLLTPTPYVSAPAEWQLYSYSLANYSNSNVFIGFQCVSNNGFILLIDKVKVAAASPTDNPIPLVSKLKNNYPNPFNPETNIAFDLAKNSKVEVEIYNIKGQKVKTLVNEVRQAGSYNVVWKGTDDNNKSVASGIYFCKLKAGKYTSTRKMLMLK